MARDSISSQRECPTKRSVEVWKEEGIDIDLSKLTVSQATYAFFKKEGLETEPSGTDKYNSSSYYLASVKGIDKGAANVPQELKDAYQKKNGKALELKDKTGKDLGQFDYFSMSGWMNTVDNRMGNVGAGEYQVRFCSRSRQYTRYPLAVHTGRPLWRRSGIWLQSG